MPRTHLTLMLLGSIHMAATTFAGEQAPSSGETTDTEGTAQNTDWKLIEPVSHKNLTIMLVVGGDLLQDRTFITLQSAMEKQLIRVNETGNVNQLSVENLSPDDIFIQSGEIVCGGKQDRVLAVDIILPAKSGKTPIEAFCVESGRWQRRGSESTATFSQSTNMAPSSELKLAIRQKRDQRKVWRSVARNQSSLSGAVGGMVRDSRSVSSLELTLESDAIKEGVAEYVKAYEGLLEKHKNAIGLVVAVEGEVQSADIYASHDLFTQLWPKLLEVAAIEALSTKEPTVVDNPELLAQAQAFLADKEAEKATSRDVSTNIQLNQCDYAARVFFETVEKNQATPWIHRSYVRKVETGTKANEAQGFNSNNRGQRRGNRMNRAND